MFDQDVAIALEAAPGGHAFSRLCERLGAQHDGWNTEFFELRGVVQTAPRATPSISHRRDGAVHISCESLELLRLGQHAGLTGGEDGSDQRHVIALFEQVVNVADQFFRIGFDIVQQTDPHAVEAAKPRCDAAGVDWSSASRIERGKCHLAALLLLLIHRTRLISRVTKSPGGTAYTHVGMMAVRPPLPPPATTTRMSSGTR